MKIKSRLFLSNLMMLVIPVAACMLVSYSILFVFTRSSQNPIERSFPQALHVIDNFQKANDGEDLIASAQAFNDEFGEKNLWVAVARGGRFVYPENAEETLAACKELFPAILSEGVSGNISVNGVRVYAEQSGEYSVLFVDLRADSSDLQFSDRPSYYNVLLIFSLLIAMVILTNRILTRFLTKSITGPLDSLVAGVHELRDGNLEYRIVYRRKDEFAPVCDDFNEMAEHLQDLIEHQRRDEGSRKELLAGISHDLRTPLTSIKAYVEGLLDGVAEDYPTQLKYLGVIRKKADDIDRIVDKLFLFSKLDIGEFPFYHEKLDIGAELSAVVAAAAEEYAGKGLSVSLKSNLPGVYVYVDPVQLHGALMNIMENSLNYKNKPMGALTIECLEREREVELRLTDDGPGVPEETLDKLFEVFYRGDAARKNPGKGSGLGLAITSRVVNRMGGSIRAENAADGGLSLIMTIPKYTGEEMPNEKNPDH